MTGGGLLVAASMLILLAAGGPRLASAAHGLIGAAIGTAWAVTGGGLLVAASMLILLAAFPGFARYQTSHQPAGTEAAIR